MLKKLSNSKQRTWKWHRILKAPLESFQEEVRGGHRPLAPHSDLVCKLHLEYVHLVVNLSIRMASRLQEQG